MSLNPHVSEELPNAVQSLLDPSFYVGVSWIDPIEKTPELIQTHISYIVLTGSRCLKVKKDVNMGFLDFSSVEKRQLYCRKEVVLNRRFAPDFYLGVAPLRSHGGSLSLGHLDPVFDDATKLNSDAGTPEMLPITSFELLILLPGFPRRC
eukprot:TRINITY_DN1758_c0_g1_i4.p1 TRINITY_DN1758_c0_g1~~TRINITY_DN1758_c0_g1_i4.p1  ORF type:complete len:150 (-),score=20.08 TRINITY_DN1758_c0_g1_i4:12-461(-)